MSQNQCRICRESKISELYEQISPYHAQILLDFGIKIPKFNVCCSICGPCKDLLESYERLKELCDQSGQYFRPIEANLKEPHNVKKEIIPEAEQPETSNAEEEQAYLDDLIEVDGAEEQTEVVTEEVKTICEENFETIDIVEDQENVEGSRSPSPKRFKKNEAKRAWEKFACKLCNNSFPTEKALLLHINTVHKANFVCGKCGKTFAKEERLTSHMDNFHPVEAYYECLKCDLVFKAEAELETHVAGIHFSDPHDFKCEYCAKVCRSEAHLKTHRLKHEDFVDEEHLDEGGEQAFDEAIDEPLPDDAAYIDLESVSVGGMPKLKPPCIKVRI